MYSAKNAGQFFSLLSFINKAGCFVDKKAHSCFHTKAMTC